MTDMQRELDRIFERFPKIHTGDIPGIDLYMDQVTTFLQDNLRDLARDPVGDKFLTKTMINNYVKNKVLLPPVKKKYSREHMMFLIMIYYMKSFLSIGDIRGITAPVMEKYTSNLQVAARGRHAAEEEKSAAAKGRRQDGDSRGEPRKDARYNDRTDSGRKSAQEPDVFKAGKASAQKDITTQDIYEKVIGNIESELPAIHEAVSRQIRLAEEDFAEVPEEDRALLTRFSLICRLSGEIYLRKLFIEKLIDLEK